MKLLLATAAALGAVAALAQLRITSFDSSGELAWTNPIQRGLYSVESGSSLAGPWSPLASVVDKDGAKTNRITLQVPLANGPAFYRVGWVPPDPVGAWDYRGYDNQGTLVITGLLSLPSTTLSTTNPPVVYDVQGSWNLQYAGPPTNELWWLGPQIGTGYFGGTIEFQTAFFRLWWPTNGHDNNMFLSGDLWSNTYTGRWNYSAFGPVASGSFAATRTPSTNQSKTKPAAREAGKLGDKFE